MQATKTKVKEAASLFKVKVAQSFWAA